MFLLFYYDDLNALTEDKGLLHVMCHVQLSKTLEYNILSGLQYNK